jgi:thiol:disulfide interchange protein
VFELPVLGGRARPAGSFGTGALAAFVATPCAGPFLGAALGAALLLPLAGSVLVFAALGLGLALPFLVVAFVPALRTRLPKPGRWMDRLKRILAVPMALSALAALWLLWRQAGVHGASAGIWWSLSAIFALWLLGSTQRKGLLKPWITASIAVVLVLCYVGALLELPKRSIAVASPVAGGERWTEAAAARYAAEGHPVFVYFTADWCLTCKANEAGAIDRDEVRVAFKAAGVKVLVGDWTNGDPAITRFLESRGRAGVPLYLWYTPGKPPEELPQVLTPGMLTSRAQSAKR